MPSQETEPVMRKKPPYGPYVPAPTGTPIFVRFRQLLPPTWPDKTWPDWETGPNGGKGRKYKMGTEDRFIPPILDHIAKRDKKQTGSLAAFLSAGAPYEGSKNHNFLEATNVYLRDGSFEKLLSLLRDDFRNGFMYFEQAGKYINFFLIALFASRIHAHSRGNQDVELIEAIEKWLSWAYGWLDTTNFKKGIVTTGFRREFCRDPYDYLPYCVFAQMSINIRDNKLGYWPDVSKPAASRMGGCDAPIASDVWLGLICGEMNLLNKVLPVFPFLKYPMSFVRTGDSRLMVYHPVNTIAWRPGGYEILVAVEQDGSVLTEWLVTKDMDVTDSWGFDPIERKVIGAEFIERKKKV